jgi:putative tricarboxylic transport membrane protein
VSEILRSARQIHNWDALVPGFSAKFPGRPELRRMVRPVVLGTTLGSFIGAIPGMSGVAAAAVSYQQAKILSKHPEEFGNGSLEGIAANEAAQNASTAGEMVPTLGLGIPGSDSMVLLLTALTIHGLLPGPLLVRETPDMLYAAVAGLLGGTLVLALVGWQISRMLLRAVSLDRRLVLAVALGLVIIGVFSLRQSVFDLLVLLVFSLIGYFMLRYGYSTAAAAIAVILGGLAEGYLRQGLNLVKNDWGAFLGRPITATILVIAFAILGYGIWMTVREIRSASVPGPEAGADPT